jgi:hypothetical protein
MRTKTLALAFTALVVGLLAWRARSARVVSGAVTSLDAGTPPLARVSLGYGGGRPAATMIVDVLDEKGTALGSITTVGGRRLLEIPLHRTAQAYRIAVTAYHRQLSGVRQEHFLGG